MLYRRPGSLAENKCWADLLAKVAGSDPSGTLSEEAEGRAHCEVYGWKKTAKLFRPCGGWGGGVMLDEDKEIHYPKVQKTVKY
jgi:hypothetical protein